MTQPYRLFLDCPNKVHGPTTPASSVNWHKNLASHDKLCGNGCADSGKRIKARTIRQSSGDLDVAFIGESPGVDEIHAGECFVGESGKFLNTFIEKALPGRNILIDNAYAHPLDGGHGKPTPEQLDSCGPRLKSLIFKTKPKVVVMMGEFAMRAFGLNRKVLDACGDVYPIDHPDGFTSWGICGVHPAYVLRAPYEVRYMANVFDKIRGMTRPEFDYEISEAKDLDALLASTKDRVRSFDIETQGKIPFKGGILLFGVAWRQGNKIKARYFKGPLNEVQRKKIAKWMCSGHIIMHNAKYEESWVRPSTTPVLSDTMIRQWFIDENERLGLDNLVLRYCKMQPYWFDLPQEMDNLQDADQDVVGRYCAMDCVGTFKLYEWQEDKLTPKQKLYLFQFGNPFTDVLRRMEENGLYIDVPALQALEKKLEREVDELEFHIGKKFPGVNWNSPVQVRKLLFEDMGLRPLEFTAKGNEPSTSKEVIGELAEKNPELKPIVAIRQKRSKLGRIVRPILEKVNKDSILVTTFNYGFTDTGRLSSSNPNVQNIERQDDPKNPEYDPSKGEEKKCIRSRFKGGKLVKVDYGQFELLLTIIYARDRMFKRYLDQGLDPHTETAKIHKVDRQTGKRINLSMVSGISPKGLNYEYGIPLKEAQRFHTVFFKTHPDIEVFHRGLTAKVIRDGYVENLVGRRRHLPYARAEEWPLVASAKKKAKNFPIQGGAADIIAAALVKIDMEFRKRKLQSLLILQIHDEIVVDAHPSELKLVESIVVKHMLNPFDEEFYVPLRAEVSIGDTLWKE